MEQPPLDGNKKAATATREIIIDFCVIFFTACFSKGVRRVSNIVLFSCGSIKRVPTVIVNKSLI